VVTAEFSVFLRRSSDKIRVIKDQGTARIFFTPICYFMWPASTLFLVIFQLPWSDIVPI
jgi:hypothetical protein